MQGDDKGPGKEEDVEQREGLMQGQGQEVSLSTPQFRYTYNHQT